MRVWSVLPVLVLTAAGCSDGDSVALDVQVVVPADMPTIEAGVLVLTDAPRVVEMRYLEATGGSCPVAPPDV